MAARGTNRRGAPRLLRFAAVAVPLALFAVTAARAIPYDFRDLFYLFSLEEGTWTPQEWMHPLWVPLLDGYRALLGLFGLHGHMLVPIEVLNVGIAVAALALLFTLTRCVTGDALLAVAAMLTTATCGAFWESAVRPTPYALAFTCLTASLALLISDQPVTARRYAAAGVLAGLAMGLHASAMALGPVALVCAAREPDPARTRATTVARTAAFGVAMTATAAACWALFVARNDIGLDHFRDAQLSTTFSGIEQVPGTSIYTSHSPLKQVADFTTTLVGKNMVLCFVAGPLLALALRQRRSAALRATGKPIERRFATAAFANFALLGGFFLINNTHNGFIFASLALVPAALALLATRLRHGRPLYLGLASLLVVGLAWSALRGIRDRRQFAAQDALLSEVRYLGEQLGPKDIVLTPGCPFAEMGYLATLHLIEVRTPGAAPGTCEAPHACIDPTLRDRVAFWRTGGSRVLLALGDEVTDFAVDASGEEKQRQIFWDPRLTARERAPRLASVRAAFDAAGLVLGAVLTSPAGDRYAEVQPREAGAASTLPQAAPFTLAELRSALGHHDPDRSRRARILADLAAALPGDPWSGCDRMQLACEAGAQRRGADLCAPLAGCSSCE